LGGEIAGCICFADCPADFFAEEAELLLTAFLDVTVDFLCAPERGKFSCAGNRFGVKQNKPSNKSMKKI
jgi:hypothetical protein